jgi:hypothetical protein
MLISGEDVFGRCCGFSASCGAAHKRKEDDSNYRLQAARDHVEIMVNESGRKNVSETCQEPNHHQSSANVQKRDHLFVLRWFSPERADKTSVHSLLAVITRPV